MLFRFLGRSSSVLLTLALWSLIASNFVVFSPTARVVAQDGRNGETVVEAVPREASEYVSREAESVSESGSSRSGNSSTPEFAPQRYVLIVSVSQYDKVPSLRFADSDAVALKKRFIETGIPESQIVLMRSSERGGLEPTKRNIENCFNNLLRRLRSGDLIVVFLSGHGFRTSREEEDFFAPKDVDFSRLKDSSVSITKMFDALRRSDAKFRWVIVDSCRDEPLPVVEEAGILKGLDYLGAPLCREGAPSEILPFARVPRSSVLTQSCDVGQKSFEGGYNDAKYIENGFFTLSLLEALDPKTGRADVDYDGTVTFAEARRYVENRTRALAARYYGASQTPTTTDADDADFPLLTNISPASSRSALREADAKFNRALDLRRAGKFDEAKRLVEAALKVDKENCEYLAASKALANEKRGALQTFLDYFHLARDERDAKNYGRALDALDGAKRIAEFGRKLSDGERDSLKKMTDEVERAVRERNADEEARRTEEGTRRTLQIGDAEYGFCLLRVETGGTVAGSGKPDWTSGVWLLETEVSNALWFSLEKSAPNRSTSLELRTESSVDESESPVSNVDWDDCRRFVEKLNKLGLAPPEMKFALPTESEWKRAFYSGRPEAEAAAFDSAEFCDVVWSRENGAGRLRPVKSKSANAWGFYGTAGNASEWCEEDDPGFAPDEFKPILGGSVADLAFDCASPNERIVEARYSSSTLSFRLALRPKSEPAASGPIYYRRGFFGVRRR